MAAFERVMASGPVPEHLVFGPALEVAMMERRAELVVAALLGLPPPPSRVVPDSWLRRGRGGG